MKYILFLPLFAAFNTYAQHAMFHAHNQTPHSCAYGCDGQLTITDARDSKVYNIVQIGSQCWMAENLNIGTDISGVTQQTNNATIEKYCYADNPANCTTYGGLYQWAEMVQYTNGASNTASPSPAFSANLQGICPSGWHLPTDAEWCTMENTVEAGTDPGCNTTSWRGTNTGVKLKTTTGWTNNGTNTSCFSALPGGYRFTDASFNTVGVFGRWWSATEGSATASWSRYVGSIEARVSRLTNTKTIGFSVRCVKDVCGDPFIINHTSGTVAPETKSVTYGTVETNLSGADKCWITQNLGADNQASSATDNTDAAAGWYWQFNRKQGYKVGPTPAWTVTAINENSDWLPANDPCTIELGTGWRIPTYTEWVNADANGAWTSYTETYNSVLKLHAAGYLNYSNGALASRGTDSFCWSSTQYSSTLGRSLSFYGSGSNMINLNKPYGVALRCLRD